MPYMKVSMSQKLTPEKALELNRKLSEAFEVLPGKTKDFIFSEIHYAGSFTYQLKNKLTAAIFRCV